MSDSGRPLPCLSRRGEVALRVRSATEFARITPEQKVRIVNALKANGEIVAMTGEYFEFLTGHETCGVKARQPSVRDLCGKLGHTPEPA